MKNIIVSLIAFMGVLLCFDRPAAQSGLRVQDVYGTLSPKRTFEPTRISVEMARYAGIESINRQDSVLLRNCTVILQNDLDFSPYFEIVHLDTFYMRHMEITEMTLLAWKTLGARYSVKLEVEFPRDKISVRYRLFSNEDEREIQKERFEIARKYYRSAVHEIANSIVKFLTGDDGVYRTKIVYSRQIDEARELFIADFDGHNPRQLTNNNSVNISPAFSPDGHYLYFTSYMDDQPKIHMLNLETNEIDVIAEYAGLNAAPQVSPDGKSIACVLSKDGNSEIYLLDRKGQIKRRLTNSWAIETSPTWSPDGKEIAFTSDRTGSPQIYIIDAEGFNLRRLTYRGSYNDSPCWSPRGDRIIFVSREGGFKICSIDITGKDFRVLTHHGNNENPRFSPDGNHIVFTSNRGGSNDIYTMDLFGDNQRNITSWGGCSNPAWAPMPD